MQNVGLYMFPNVVNLFLVMLCFVLAFTRRCGLSFSCLHFVTASSQPSAPEDCNKDDYFTWAHKRVTLKCIYLRALHIRACTRTKQRTQYRSMSSIFGCDLWLLFSRGHSHLGDDGHIDLINSFIYCQSLPFILTHTNTHTAKTHRFTAGTTQLSASSIPHLLHVCFSLSLLFLFSSPQATSPSPLLSARFNSFLFSLRSRHFHQHLLPATCFSINTAPPRRGLISLISSTQFSNKVIS